MNRLSKFLSKHKKLRNVLLTATAGLTLYSCGSSKEVSNNKNTQFSDSLTTQIEEMKINLNNHSIYLDNLYLETNKKLLNSNYISNETKKEIKEDIAILTDKLSLKDTNYQKITQPLLAEEQDTTKVDIKNHLNNILAEEENNQSLNIALGFTDTTLQVKEVINPVKYTIGGGDTAWKVAKGQLIKEGIQTPSNNQISERVINISEWNNINKNTDIGCMKDQKYTLNCKDGLYPDLIFPGNEFIVGYTKTKEYSTLKKIEPIKQDTTISQPDTTSVSQDTLKSTTEDTLNTSTQEIQKIVPEYLSQTEELNDSLTALSCKIDEGLFDSTDRLKFVKNLYKVDKLYNKLNKKDYQNSTVDSTILATEDFMRDLMDKTLNTLKSTYDIGETDLLLDLPKKESRKNLENELNFGSRIIDYCFDILIDYPKFPIELPNKQNKSVKIDSTDINLEETITDSLPYFQNQVDIYNTQIDSLLPQYKTIKSTYDSLTVRYKELKEELRPIKDDKDELKKKKQEIREYKQLKKQRNVMRKELKLQQNYLLDKRDQRDSIEGRIQMYNSKQDSSKTTPTPKDSSTSESNKPLQTEWSTFGEHAYKQGRDGRWRVKQSNAKGSGVYASNKAAHTAGMMNQRDYNDFLIRQRI